MIVFPARLLVGIAKEIEFELGGYHRYVPQPAGPLDLPREDLAGRLRRRIPRFVADVAQGEGAALEPPDAAHRAAGGTQPPILVAGRPTRQPVPGQRLHLHVARQQIAARVHPVPRYLVCEEPPRHALAHQPSLHVDHRGDHRVDGAVRNPTPERVHGQAAFRGLGHVVPPFPRFGWAGVQWLDRRTLPPRSLRRARRAASRGPPAWSTFNGPFV